MVVQVLQQQAAHFFHQGRDQMLARGQVVGNFTKNPGPPLRGAAHHQGIGPAGLQRSLGGLRAGDVAIDHHRDAHRLLDGGHRGVFGLAFVALLARTAVDGEHLHAHGFKAPGQGHGVFMRLAPAGAHF